MTVEEYLARACSVPEPTASGNPDLAALVLHQKSTLEPLTPPEGFERYHEASLAFATEVVAMVEDFEAGNREAFQTSRLEALSQDVRRAFDALVPDHGDAFIEHECLVPAL